MARVRDRLTGEYREPTWPDRMWPIAAIVLVIAALAVWLARDAAPGVFDLIIG